MTSDGQEGREGFQYSRRGPGALWLVDAYCGGDPGWGGGGGGGGWWCWWHWMNWRHCINPRGESVWGGGTGDCWSDAQFCRNWMAFRDLSWSIVSDAEGIWGKIVENGMLRMWSGGGSVVLLRNKLCFAGTRTHRHLFNHRDHIYKKKLIATLYVGSCTQWWTHFCFLYVRILNERCY